MAYMISDIPAGSEAIKQLQQNVAAAPYTSDLTKVASERKLQEDRLAIQYAPQIAAAKVEEEQMRLQTARLQKLATETKYQADTESTAKLQQWLKTPEGQAASDVDILKKSASLKMQAGLIEDGSKLLQQSATIEAKEIQAQTKQLAQDSETIAKAAVALNAVSDDNVEDYFNRLPQETKNLIEKQVGADNWSRFTGGQKKEVVNNLFINAKGQLTERLKEIELKKTDKLVENRLEVATLKANATKEVETMKAEARKELQQEKDAAALERKIKDLEAQAAREEAKGKLKKELEDMAEKFKLRLEKLREAGKDKREQMRETGKDTRASNKEARRDVAFFFKEHDKIVKAGQKEEELLVQGVTNAQKLYEESKKASWYDPAQFKESKREEAYNKAVDKLNKFRANQAQQELDVLEAAPDFPKKESMVTKLKERKALFETPAGSAPPSPAAKESKPSVPSNKYTEDNPAKPTSKEEYDKLPPGSYYIQDGVTKRKKG